MCFLSSESGFLSSSSTTLPFPWLHGLTFQSFLTVYVFGSPLHYYGLALGLFVLSVQSCKMGIFNMHLHTVIMAFGHRSGFVVLDDWVVVNLGSMDLGLGFN